MTRLTPWTVSKPKTLCFTSATTFALAPLLCRSRLPHRALSLSPSIALLSLPSSGGEKAKTGVLQVWPTFFRSFPAMEPALDPQSADPKAAALVAELFCRVLLCSSAALLQLLLLLLLLSLLTLELATFIQMVRVTMSRRDDDRPTRPAQQARHTLTLPTFIQIIRVDVSQRKDNIPTRPAQQAKHTSTLPTFVQMVHMTISIQVDNIPTGPTHQAKQRSALPTFVQMVRMTIWRVHQYRKTQQLHPLSSRWFEKGYT